MNERMRWQRLNAVLDAVLDLPADGRADRVRALCADDPDLAAEALRFLDDAVSADGFLARPAGETVADLVEQTVGRDDPEARLGQRLGAWELTGILGEGGMGVVYAARRADGQYEAEAAVKLMLSVDPRSPLRRRLLDERQILARLDDPRIARLYDGGLSGDGHPYLVMERVDGRDILEHCRHEGLDRRRRLDLFGEVCGAVHSAHRRLILHCDLKPSNILVTPRGELKLLDFGIARTLESGVEDPQTSPLRLLTPGYASPEQLAGAHLTTASDVYGLGVLLHELLTGGQPGEGERPRGDLGNILDRALAVDPNARYGSARDLADDLRRWRRGRPVEATPSTFGYRLRRLVGRNRLATAAVAAVTLAVVSGGAVAAWQASVASDQRDAARREAARANAVNTFLTSLFEVADPNVNVGEDPTVREVLDQGRDEIAALDGEPATQATLASVLGRVYFRLGHFDESRDLYRLELAAEREAFGTESDAVSDTRIDLAVALLELGETAAADAQIDTCLAYREPRPRARDPRWLSIPRSVQARIANDRADYQTSVDLYDGVLGSLDHEDEELQEALGRAYLNFGSSLAGLGRMAAADSAYAEALMHFDRSLPTHHSHFGSLYSNWALVVHSLGDLERAERFQRRALAIKRRLKHNRVDIGVSLINLGNLLVDRGRPGEAVPLLTEAVAIQREAFGDAHLYVGAAEINLGAAWLAQGDPVAADSRFAEGQAVFRRALGDDNPAVAVALTRRAQAARAAGDHHRAALLLEESLAMHRRHLPAYRNKFGEALLEMAEVQASRGRAQEADAFAQEAAAVLGETIGKDHPTTARAQALVDRAP